MFTIVIACDTKKKKEEKPKEKIEVTEPIIKKYGFVYNDFHVVNDTIKSGDTFGTLLQNYVLPDSLNVHQLTEKIRDSFNLRGMKAGNPYVLLFDKQKKNDLKAFQLLD